jgi:hypothetical protein
MPTRRPRRLRRRRPRLAEIDDGETRRLTLAPLAWLKWQYFCHAGPTEVAAFGLSALEEPLDLDDLLVARPLATPVTVAFDDAAVADLFDRLAGAGVPPRRKPRPRRCLSLRVAGGRANRRVGVPDKQCARRKDLLVTLPSASPSRRVVVRYAGRGDRRAEAEYYVTSIRPRSRSKRRRPQCAVTPPARSIR